MPRLSTHQTVRHAPGRHDDPAQGACVLELASLLAGERFSDRPRAVSPVIAALLRAVGDEALGDRDPYTWAAELVGTRAGGRVRRARRALCRRKSLALRGVAGSRVERACLMFLRDAAGEACGAAFADADRLDEVPAFLDELVALGRPASAARHPAPPALGPRAAPGRWDGTV
ncbi:MAG TPA: hypothetical protein VFG42_24720 [Baekduia sp.]|uniref:hypothetical protein n=1 Tax=Baekduia sp. TaxID=2600305 RepID=UPI002D7A2A68|nr:hypothetical protein [Baekduia sp.]HET6510021.1 hypothetical protein [Baekduia sp.]